MDFWFKIAHLSANYCGKDISKRDNASMDVIKCFAFSSSKRHKAFNSVNWLKCWMLQPMRDSWWNSLRVKISWVYFFVFDKMFTFECNNEVTKHTRCISQ